MTSATTTTTPAVTPDLVMGMVSGFHRTAALKAAVELELFTAIGEGATAVAAIADRCGASERGTRMLADYFTIAGLLTKSDGEYALTPVAAAFLDKRSPQYIGGVLGFMAGAPMYRAYDDLTETVRRGTADPARSFVTPENPIWVDFARSMVPLAMPVATVLADVLQVEGAGSLRVLDIAAGHGMYGISVATRNPQVEVTAVDWPNVLRVATENARRLGVEARHHVLAGDAFEVDFGDGYDVALVTNFLHHFDVPSSGEFLRKVAAALKPGGRVAVVEFVPNEDRVTPPSTAGFVINMLAGTASGDVYTTSDLGALLDGAGFDDVTFHATPTPQTIVLATKR